VLKYKIGVLFVLILIVCEMSFVRANNQNLPLLGKVIYIDPGHGGLDPGALYKNIKESDINLEISKQIEETLTKLGAIVYLTRYGDYDLSVNNTINRKRSDLSRRRNIINKSECDIFLSIHLNAEETGVWKGAQVFYNDINKENEKIAKIFQEEFRKNLYSTRKYKKDNSLYMQKKITRPGILVEVGFLSNANDRYLLRQKTYHQKVSNVIANALIKYFNN